MYFQKQDNFAKSANVVSGRGAFAGCAEPVPEYSGIVWIGGAGFCFRILMSDAEEFPEAAG